MTVKTNKTHAYFDEMAWPRTGETIGNLESVLRYGKVTTGQILTAASVIAAYRALVWSSRAKREAVVRRLREAEGWKGASHDVA